MEGIALRESALLAGDSLGGEWPAALEVGRDLREVDVKSSAPRARQEPNGACLVERARAQGGR
ncbi:hypothetical protein DIPPA_06936 [Diplonema papillatum]|nr:hypothetical protein DIPPA_06936 [Diplonema papillatum]